MIDVLLIAVLVGLPIAWHFWRLERKRIAENTRRNVMASVMDTQNNLLNNIVYFRTRAEANGTLTPAELTQIDCTVRDTQARLREIAEAELNETRDLRGIKVLASTKTKAAG